MVAPVDDLETLICRACNGLMESADVGLNLDVADIVKLRPVHAKTALAKILRIASDEIDRQAAFLAIQLLDCLMVNCGYAFRFHMARKENLNALVKRFPPSPSFHLDHAMKRTLKLVNKWKLSLCDKSRQKHDFSNIVLMYDLLASKNFIFPPVSSEEIDSMVGLELQTLRTKESLQDEEKLVLETKLDYYLSRGGPKDLKHANEIMRQMIELQDPMKYSIADSQIMQDLQKLTDKISLLEELVKSESEDVTSLQALLENPTIGQMYRACRDEIPKLLELANSNLNEDLMNRIISVTERLSAIKRAVEEESPKSVHDVEGNLCNLSLARSAEFLSLSSPPQTAESVQVFNDLPVISPKSLQKTNFADSDVQVKWFKANADLLVDFIALSKEKGGMLRVMNVSNQVLDGVKLNGKPIKSKLEPFESFIASKAVEIASSEVNITYSGGQLGHVSQVEEPTDNLMKNLLLI